jgi:hypothetical protein
MHTVRKLIAAAIVTLALPLGACTSSTALATSTAAKAAKLAAAKALVASKAAAAAAKALAAAKASAGAASVVPWLDEPATLSMLASLQPRPLPLPRPQTGAPPCVDSNLSVVTIRPVSATQDDGVIIGLRNTSHAACMLSGRPGVVAAEPGEPTVVAEAEAVSPYGEKADTPAGGIVFVQVDVPSSGCPADPTGSDRGYPVYHSLIITLPGGVMRQVSAFSFRFPCGMSATPFFMPTPQQSYPVNRVAALVPQLRLPAAVKAGTTLHFEVDLSNPGNRSVALSPCPVYIEASGPAIKLEYRLNCRSVRTIAGHARVRYAMEMAIPRSAQAGEARIYWGLVAATAPSCHGELVVRPSWADRQ